MAYQCKRIELTLKKLTAELAAEDDGQAQAGILAKIGDYNRARTRINKELGRV